VIEGEAYCWRSPPAMDWNILCPTQFAERDAKRMLRGLKDLSPKTIQENRRSRIQINDENWRANV
jgi:hypothetical protein